MDTLEEFWVSKVAFYNFIPAYLDIWCLHKLRFQGGAVGGQGRLLETDGQSVCLGSICSMGSSSPRRHHWPAGGQSLPAQPCLWHQAGRIRADNCHNEGNLTVEYGHPERWVIQGFLDGSVTDMLHMGLLMDLLMKMQWLNVWFMMILALCIVIWILMGKTSTGTNSVLLTVWENESHFGVESTCYLEDRQEPAIITFSLYK